MPNIKSKTEKEETGIWKYADFYSESIKLENRLVLDDGNTRELESESINKLVGGRVFFKREDENKTESLKGRSLAFQVSLAKQRGAKELVISTSGNAGIAAAAYCRKAGIRLYVFISPDTEAEKILSMQRYSPVIVKSKKAIRLANYLSAKKRIQNLRPSRDESSIEGFKSISFEIFEHIGEIDALFTFVTSGSSFVGIGKAFEYLNKTGKIRKMPKLFAIQGGTVFSIAREFERINDACSGGGCKTGKFGVRETMRKNEIIEMIKTSGGGSFYITDLEIEAVRKILAIQEIYTSGEGCASFAGLYRWSKANKFNKAVCVLSGKEREAAEKTDENGIYRAESFEEINKIIQKFKNLCLPVDRNMENDNAKC